MQEIGANADAIYGKERQYNIIMFLVLCLPVVLRVIDNNGHVEPINCILETQCGVKRDTRKYTQKDKNSIKNRNILFYSPHTCI